MTYREKFKQFCPAADVTNIHLDFCPFQQPNVRSFPCPFPDDDFSHGCSDCWDREIPNMIEEAIMWFEDEISRLKAAPGLNGCRMQPEWEEQIKFHTLAIVALRAKQTEEKNEPLTLDELRDMEGEPCYIVSGKFEDWRIPDFIDQGAYKGFIRFTDRSAEPIDAYGKTWLAYRHKPLEH